MKRQDLTGAIAAPKFRVGRFIFNEYEARMIMLRVAKGELPAGMKMTNGGITAIIREDGRLSANLPGFALSTEILTERLKVNWEKDKINK
jgi:hypothetical protein